MRSLVTLFCFTLLSVSHVLAATGWAGANLFYAAGLSASQRKTYLAALQQAKMKVLRLWLDGQDSSTTKNTPITSWPDLETTIGQYNDQVLELIDDFMLDARAHGIKLLITLHSWNTLSRPDIYGQTYGTTGFYENATAIAQFDNRLRYILNHKHKTLGIPWKDLSFYIFAFEAENEAMIGISQDFVAAHASWQCDRAQTLREELGSSPILVTDGGESWVDESVNPTLLSCPALDAIALHGYGVGDLQAPFLETYVQEAIKARKKMFYEEWGACYYNTTNNRCNPGTPLTVEERNLNITWWAHNISVAGLGQMYWEVLPNADPHYDWDYEIGIQDLSWPTLKQAALESYEIASPFDFSLYLP